jgi:hypothetical protein
VGLLERRPGIVGRLFHRQQKSVEFCAVRLIDEVLSSSELISDIWWHYDESGPLRLSWRGLSPKAWHKFSCGE